MSITADLSIPADELSLGRALARTPDLAVELETVVPTGNGVAPYLWVVGEDRDGFGDVLADTGPVSGFDVVDDLDDRTLYRVRWGTPADPFVRLVTDHDVALRAAGGDAERWEFRILFPDSRTLTAFHTACREADVAVDVETLHHAAEDRFGYGMTDAQRLLVERAYDEGYFDVPRRITLQEIGEQLGISDQSVNERLRRGLNALVGSTVKRRRPDE